MSDTQHPTPQPSGVNIHALCLFSLLILALYFAYEVARPFLHTLIISAVLAVIFDPLHRRFLALCRDRRALASALTTLVILVALVIPLWFLFFGLVHQGMDAVKAIDGWIRGRDFQELIKASGVEGHLAWIKEQFPFLDLAKLDIQSSVVEATKTAGQQLLRASTSVLANLAGLTIHFLLMLFMIFTFLRDGPWMVARLRELIPLREEQTGSIFDSLKRVSRSVLVGSLLVAVLQGFVGGIGLAIIGIPALFWGTVMGFSSLIPVLGTGLVWIPAVGYLLLTSQFKAALFVAIWCGALVTSIDTFLRPVFLRDASKVSTLYIFLSILGGLQVFGPLGLLYGPLVLSFVMVMLQIYGDEYCNLKTPPPPGCPPRD